ncbi:hypothetical protein ABW21_db0207152 [Orbilia brochopaga]|nr:hypothetical protein ABW21_db0207152 [Drechslerella brochopaga]
MNWAWHGRKADDDERAIVFVKSRQDAERISKAWGCLHHHSGLQPADKAEAFERWRTAAPLSRKRIIIATSGLYQGIDMANLSLVIMLEPPDTIYDLVQAMGRAGRNGKDAVIRIITTKGTRLKFAPDTPGTEGLIGRFLRTESCRHLVLSQGMDGRTTMCDPANQISCDNCARKNGKSSKCEWMIKDARIKSWQNLPVKSQNQVSTVASQPPPSIRAITNKQFKDAEDVYRTQEADKQAARDEFTNALLGGRTTCPICRVRDPAGSEWKTHPFLECKQKKEAMESKTAAIIWANLLPKRQWIPLGSCGYCMLPDNICGRSGSNSCTFRLEDTIYPLCWAAYRYQQDKFEPGSKKFASNDEFFQMIIEPADLFGLPSSKAVLFAKAVLNWVQENEHRSKNNSHIRLPF